MCVIIILLYIWIVYNNYIFYILYVIIKQKRLKREGYKGIEDSTPKRVWREERELL